VAIVFGKAVPNVNMTSSLTENSFQRDKLLKDVIDQLYKETVIRFEIEKKMRVLEREVSNQKTDDRKGCVNQADGKNDSQGMNFKYIRKRFYNNSFCAVFRV
jgi:hypothetical protein